MKIRLFFLLLALVASLVLVASLKARRKGTPKITHITRCGEKTKINCDENRSCKEGQKCVTRTKLNFCFENVTIARCVTKKCLPRSKIECDNDSKRCHEDQHCITKQKRNSCGETVTISRCKSKRNAEIPECNKEAQQMISCGDDNPCAAGKCCATSTKVNACNQTVRIARCNRLAAEGKPCSLNAVVHCPCQNNLVCRPPTIDSLPCCVDGDEASEKRSSKKLKRKRKLKAKKKDGQRSSCSPCRVAREPRSDEEQKMVCSRAE